MKNILSRYREVGIVAIGEIIVILIMFALFFAFDAFDYTVILGALLGAVANLICAFFLCLAINKVIDEQDPQKGSRTVALSRYLRLAIMAVALIIGFKLPCFNNIAVIVPLLVTRPSLSVHSLISKGVKK